MLLLLQSGPGQAGGAAGPTGSTWSTTDKSSITLSNANLTATGAGGQGGVRGNLGVSTGKYYFEVTMNTWTSAGSGTGMASGSANVATLPSDSTQAAEILRSGGQIWISGVNPANLGTRASGDIIGIAADVGAQLIWFRVAPSGQWNASGTANPATGTGGLSMSALTRPVYACFGAGVASEQATINNGQSTFSGAVPSGFAPGLA